MQAENATICTHYSNLPTARNVYFNDRYNTCRSSSLLTGANLDQLLSCKECAVLTPTISMDNLGWTILEKRISQIYFWVLSKFSALLSLPFKSTIDPSKHPILAKWARSLALPAFYYKNNKIQLNHYELLRNELKKTEKSKESEGIIRGLIIRIMAAQLNKRLVQLYAFAKPSEISQLVGKFNHFGGRDYEDNDYDKERISTLRKISADPTQIPNIFKDLTFKILFQEGFLKSRAES